MSSFSFFSSPNSFLSFSSAKWQKHIELSEEQWEREEDEKKRNKFTHHRLVAAYSKNKKQNRKWFRILCHTIIIISIFHCGAKFISICFIHMHKCGAFGGLRSCIPYSIHSHQTVVNVQRYKKKMCASISPHPTYDGNRATGNRSIDEQLKKSWYFHKYLTPNIVHTFAEATTPVDAFSDDNIFKKCSFVRSAYHRISLQFCSLNWTSWENGVVLLLLVRLSRTHVRGKDDVRSILLISRAPAH